MGQYARPQCVHGVLANPDTSCRCWQGRCALQRVLYGAVTWDTGNVVQQGNLRAFHVVTDVAVS